MIMRRGWGDMGVGTGVKVDADESRRQFKARSKAQLPRTFGSSPTRHPSPPCGH